MSFHRVIDIFRHEHLKYSFPRLSLGDTIYTKILVQEGNKQRVQIYQRIVVARCRAFINNIITVRRCLKGLGIERTFFIHSPFVQYIKIIRRSKVRCAKLYYFGNLIRRTFRFRKTRVKISYLRKNNK